jgi:hypothetical protein
MVMNLSVIRHQTISAYQSGLGIQNPCAAVGVAPHDPWLMSDRRTHGQRTQASVPPYSRQDPLRQARFTVPHPHTPEAARGDQPGPPFEHLVVHVQTKVMMIALEAALVSVQGAERVAVPYRECAL